MCPLICEDYIRIYVCMHTYTYNMHIHKFTEPRMYEGKSLGTGTKHSQVNIIVVIFLTTTE